MKTYWDRFALTLVLLLLTQQLAVAQLMFEQPPIHYSESQAKDRVAKWGRTLENECLNPDQADEHYGFLQIVLEELDIDVSSQTLVYSKTSLQRHLISSENPRAIYFNEDTYVGWIPGGELIEIASVDPQLGTVFYVVAQPGEKDSGVLRRRGDRCLFCHASSDSGRVPGLLMQSVLTSKDGNRVFSLSGLKTNPRGPLEGRFGGWFATGMHGSQTHLGNLLLQKDTELESASERANVNVTDLSDFFDPEKYMTSGSDIVALLVLRHQVTLHNTLTDANHRVRRQLYLAEGDRSLAAESHLMIDSMAWQVVSSLLMVDEISLTDPVQGDEGFVREFTSRGPRDAAGRSLRDLDLQTRLFKFPCSYLIYSNAFDGLPSSLLDAIGRNLRLVLNEKQAAVSQEVSRNFQTQKFEYLSDDDRTALREILQQTKPSLMNRSAD